jgi:hypothetical protein
MPSDLTAPQLDPPPRPESRRATESPVAGWGDTDCRLNLKRDHKHTRHDLTKYYLCLILSA